MVSVVPEGLVVGFTLLRAFELQVRLLFGIVQVFRFEVGDIDLYLVTSRVRDLVDGRRRRDDFRENLAAASSMGEDEGFAIGPALESSAEGSFADSYYVVDAVKLEIVEVVDPFSSAQRNSDGGHASSLVRGLHSCNPVAHTI